MKITFENPIVEMTGDEMAQVMWDWIKEYLINEFFEGPILVYDLSIQNRDKTEDQVTIDAAKAVVTYRVGVKCATITPDEERVKEFSLKKLWPSPNGTIRNIINGTVFREPIIISNVPRLIPHWRLPIIVARHAYGDQYKPFEIRSNNLSEIEIKTASTQQKPFDLNEEGIFLAIHNTKKSIEGFARSVFNFSLLRGYDCYFSTKNTILKTYDGFFKEIFEQIFQNEFANKFEAKNLKYEHRLIDDMVAKVLKSEGGFVWALKNYDGDVESDMVAQGFGSLGLMTSVLLSSDGKVVETEAAHGTVTRHYRAWQKGESVSTNPIASIFAWTQALYYRGIFDNKLDLVQGAQKLEKAVRQTVEGGVYTRDLAALIPQSNQPVTTLEFLQAVQRNFRNLD